MVNAEEIVVTVRDRAVINSGQHVQLELNANVSIVTFADALPRHLRIL